MVGRADHVRSSVRDVQYQRGCERTRDAVRRGRQRPKLTQVPRGDEWEPSHADSPQRRHPAAHDNGCHPRLVSAEAWHEAIRPESDHNVRAERRHWKTRTQHMGGCHRKGWRGGSGVLDTWYIAAGTEAVATSIVY